MPLPFALDHINLWLLDEDGALRADRLPATATRRRARCGSGISRQRCAAPPLARIVATHYHPDHLGNAAWLAARFGCPITMTQAEFLTAHAVFDERRRYALADICALFALPRHGGRACGRARRARQPLPARRARAAATRSTRMLDGDRVAAGRLALAGDRRLRPLARARRAYAADAGDARLGRHAAAEDHHQRRASGRPSPTATRSARFLHSLDAFEALPPDTLVLPSHGLPFRGIALRVAELRAHHAARLAELEAFATARRRAARRRGRAAGAVPAQLDLQQRFFAMGEAIAHLNHLWHRGPHRAPRRRRRSDPLRRVNCDRPPSPDNERDPRCPRRPPPSPGQPPTPPPSTIPSRSPNRSPSAAEKSAKLMGEFASRHAATAHAASPTSSASARRSWSSRRKMLANPARSPKAQMNLWRDYMNLWQASMLKMMGAPAEPVAEPAKGDKRFKHEDWHEHFLFDYVKQSLPDHRALAARPGRQRRRPVRARPRRRSTSSRASTSTRWRRRISR